MLGLGRLYAQSAFEKASLAERLQRLLEEFCAQAQRDGLDLLPYFPDDPMGPFLRLPEDKRHLAYSTFERYYDVCSKNSSEGIRLNDNKAILWKTIRQMDLRPCSDLMDRIEDDDIVEAYDSSFIQVFRTTRFLELCSYPIDHVFFCEFHQLFKRPEGMNDRLVQLGMDIFRGELTSTKDTGIPEHVLEETHSRRRGKFLINQGIISPLFDKSKRPVLAVATIKARLLYWQENQGEPK